MKVWSIPFWFNLAAGICAIATVVSFTSSRWWIAAMLEHPRPQYVLVSAIATLVSFFVAKTKPAKRWGFVWLIPLAINLSLISPYITGFGENTIAANKTLKILHATLDKTNPDQIPLALEYLENQTVDLISLIEVTPQYLEHLQFGLKKYRVIAAEPRTSTHGSAWLASAKLAPEIEYRDSEVIHLPAKNDRPLLKITMSVGGKEVVLVSFQAVRPRDSRTVAYQRGEFAALAAWSLEVLKSGDRELIALGDYNSTPWYDSFRQILSNSDLINSQSGFGLQPTWHASLPFFLQVPIDHCLHSSGFRTIRRSVGENIGSDHLPLLVELSLSDRS